MEDDRLPAVGRYTKVLAVPDQFSGDVLSLISDGFSSGVSSYMLMSRCRGRVLLLFNARRHGTEKLAYIGGTVCGTLWPHRVVFVAMPVVREGNRRRSILKRTYDGACRDPCGWAVTAVQALVPVGSVQPDAD